MHQQTKIMVTTPETDGQEKRHDETGEKEQDQRKRQWNKKIVDVLANEEGKEGEEQDETEAMT